MLSLIIPVYRNEANLDRLLVELCSLDQRFPDDLEVIFVVDGSPDRCLELLRTQLPSLPLRSELISLSRNFGSFNAIVAGLNAGSGNCFAVLAADLQEPPDLVLQFYEILNADVADIVFGCRTKRTDPWLSELSARLFWALYRRFVVKDLPAGGVDIFGCTRQVRDHIVRFREANTNLIALLFWLGFRRQYVGYERLPRLEGESAWTLVKKLRYCVDSIFNFTDLPIRLLLGAGVLACAVAVLAGFAVLIAKLNGDIAVPGYAATALLILFFGGTMTLGIGVIGQYIWLSLQNVRHRPNFVIASAERFSIDVSQNVSRFREDAAVPKN